MGSIVIAIATVGCNGIAHIQYVFIWWQRVVVFDMLANNGVENCIRAVVKNVVTMVVDDMNH